MWTFTRKCPLHRTATTPYGIFLKISKKRFHVSLRHLLVIKLLWYNNFIIRKYNLHLPESYQNNPQASLYRKNNVNSLYVPAMNKANILFCLLQNIKLQSKCSFFCLFFYDIPQSLFFGGGWEGWNWVSKTKQARSLHSFILSERRLRKILFRA